MLHLSSTINSQNSESEFLFIYSFFPPLCKTKNAGPVPFPAFVGRLSHDRSSSVSHRYKSTAESSSPYSLSPKTVTQVIVTHVMYDIIICIHIWMCLYNRVYYTHIHKTFYTGQQMECSRDSCHHMRYIDCSSAMILGTSRLLSAPDPPSGSDIGSKEYSRTPPRYYYYLSATFFFFDPIFGPLLCVVYLCPVNLLKRRRDVLSLRIIFEESQRKYPFPKIIFSSFLTIRINSSFVSGGDVLITYFQVH